MLTEEEQDCLVNVFDRPDIHKPRSEKQCICWEKDGKREYVQKRYLLWTLRDLLNIIYGVKLEGVSNINTLSDTFGKDITFSSLYNCIKSQEHLIYNRDSPQSSCLRELCENACLLAQEINNSRNFHFPTNPHDLVEKYACNSDSKQYMYRMVHVYDQCIVNWFGDEELSDEESASNNDVSKLVPP